MPRPARAAPDVPWFLPAGRAGLAPDSVTVDGEAGAGDPAVGPQSEPVTEIAGGPPWAGEPPGQDLNTPPPWESGPWPGSGLAAGDGAVLPGAVLPGPVLPGAVRHRPHPADGAEEAAAGNRLATAALVAGIAGIAVLPGLILGVLGLRRARASGTGLLKSWLAIVLSLLWAAGIVVIAALGHGSPADPGCSGYQASGRAAAARASAALSAGAPASQLGPDLSQAARAVNSAAARARGVPVRNALSALTGDLQSAFAQVTAGRQVPAPLRTALNSDVTATVRLCGGPSA